MRDNFQYLIIQMSFYYLKYIFLFYLFNWNNTNDLVTFIITMCTGNGTVKFNSIIRISPIFSLKNRKLSQDLICYLLFYQWTIENCNWLTEDSFISIFIRNSKKPFQTKWCIFFIKRIIFTIIILLNTCCALTDKS